MSQNVLLAGVAIGALLLAQRAEAEVAFSSFAYAATGAPTLRTTPNRLADVVNVKDYGAKGDGVTNDGAAIQAAFDAAFGPIGAPNANQWLNKGVFFPCGDYVVDQQLTLAPVGGSGSAAGAWVFGEGQHNTRLKYNGPLASSPIATITASISNGSGGAGTVLNISATNADLRAGMILTGVGVSANTRIVSQASGTLYGAGVYVASISQLVASVSMSAYQTAMLTTQFMNYSVIEGIKFDVTNSNATIAIELSGAGSNGGSQVSWIDCGFVGASTFGFLSATASTGSEQVFIGCTWDSCGPSIGSGVMTIDGGLVTASSNALDFTVISSVFKNCSKGISSAAGSVNLIEGCTFHSNAQIDIWVKQNNAPAIVGCYSDSPTFCLAGPVWIAGCSHVTSGVGIFIDGSGTVFGQDDPKIIIEGCYLPNSKLVGNSGCSLYLRGNSASRSDILASWAGIISENI